MTADDYQDIENVRNQAIGQLAEICAAMGLNWSATEKQFTIELPQLITMKASTQVEISDLPTRPKTFDISTWGNIDAFGNVVSSDTLPGDFQLPDYGQILEEGKPPEGDDEA